MTNAKTILVICGPTASGKTSFALSVAHFLTGNPLLSFPTRSGIYTNKHKLVNILSVDSRQLYKDLSIVTGKDIPANLPESIKFFGTDILDIEDLSNLSDFKKYSQKVISESITSDTPLIIVGGTGLYLKAITENLTDVTIPKNEDLRLKIENLPLVDLQKYLQGLNPAKYSSLNNSDVNNPRRLIRSIEISTAKQQNKYSTDKNVSAVIPDPIGDPSGNNNPSHFNYLWIGIMPSKEEITTSIHKRIIERIEHGAIDEVKALINKNSDTSLPIYTSLGVPQILSFINSEITKEELISVWERAEVDYARRQIVWFKKQPNIVWYDKGSIPENLLLEIAKKIR